VRAAALLLAFLAAGCVSRPVEPDANSPGKESAASVLYIHCDRARLTVPERLRDQVTWDMDDARPVGVTVGGLIVITRESSPECEIAGDDLSVVAEGTVLTRKSDGGYSVEEGPFQTVIYRNGKMLKR
jgi:hypothetical protein